jgi:hypothetical protein
MTQTATREVVLADIPVQAFWRLQHHHDDMLREFALIDIDRVYGGAHAVPAQLLDMVTQLRSQLAAQRNALIEALELAAERGEERTTVRLELPLAAADGIEAACRTYEQADAFCRSGELLTLSTPPELAALRRQLCEHLVEQLRG